MTQSTPYSFQTSLQAEEALALRLNDASNVYWSKDELNLYIAEALRVYNCLTQWYLQQWSTNYVQPNPATLPAWNSTGNSLNSLVGSNPTSPRYQTLKDSDVYTIAQYHLLEPATGNGTWTGTDQFSLADLSQALQRRRDTILQISACNVAPFSTTFSITPGTNSVQLPDSASQTILDVRRVRFLPASGLGNAVTLWRDDGMAFEYFRADYKTSMANPVAWDVLAGSPQYLTFDANANVPNTLDVLAILSGGVIATPTSSPLLIPDDWSWVLKFGMMADLFNKEIESTDPIRAEYCEQRFMEGLALMREMPWLTQARINNEPVDTPSVFDADQYDNEWQTNSNAQIGVIVGGIDLFAVSPTIPAGSTVGVELTLVANAPIPAADSDYVQVPRDAFDYVLDEAEHLAQFKHGGAEFQQSIALHQGFIRYCAETNRRLAESGIFASVLRPPVSKMSEDQPRFEEVIPNARP